MPGQSERPCLHVTPTSLSGPPFIEGNGFLCWVYFVNFSYTQNIVGFNFVCHLILNHYQ